MPHIPQRWGSGKLAVAALVLAESLSAAAPVADRPLNAGSYSSRFMRRESQTAARRPRRVTEAPVRPRGFSKKGARPGRTYAKIMQQMVPAAGASIGMQKGAALLRTRTNTSFSYIGIGRPKKNNAIVTLICSQHWVPGALALAASLRTHGSTADRVLLMSKDVPQRYQQVLTENFDVVRVEPAITPHPSITRIGGDCVSRQLHTWRLPYKKALYMDADMIVLKNPDSLFTHSQLTAKVDYDQNDGQIGFNGGMFVCEPSLSIYTKLVEHLHIWQQNSTRRGMQQFLNHMFPPCNASAQQIHSVPQAGCWNASLSHTHNKYTRELSFKDATELITGNNLYQSLHFSGEWAAEKKPWMKGCLMPASSTSKAQGATHEDILDLWMRAYRNVKVPAASAGLLEVECPFFNCVAPQKQLDFFVYTTHFDCVLKTSLNRLMLHASPRRLFVIGSRAFCLQFHMDNVRCLERDALLEGLSYEVIEKFIRWKVRTWSDSSIKWTDDHVKQATDKYLGRLLNMGIARKSEELGISEHYVIMDPEVVLIRNFCPFNKKGQTNFMESGDRADEHECSQISASIFEMVSGLSSARSNRSHTSFASHHAVIRTDSMNMFLDQVEKYSASSAVHSGNQVNWSLPWTWASAMLERACRTSLSCLCGFSEYAFYASWSKYERPREFAELPALYRRMAATNWSQPAPCCPASYDLSGDEGLGMGHQFVHFARDCSPPGNTTRNENEFWFYKTMSEGRENRAHRHAHSERRKRVG